MVGARCNLWNHTAKRCMDHRLACHTLSKHLTTAANEGNGTLVAARFNRQQ